MVSTTHNCGVRAFLKDAKGSGYSQEVGSTLVVMQLAEKVIKRAPKNNIRKNIMQRKEKKRGIKDVDMMEAEVATPTVKKFIETISPVLEAGTNACG